MKNLKIFLTWVMITAILLIPAISQANLSPDEFEKNTISIGVVVSDLEKSLDFYTKVIGMVKTSEFSVDEKFAKRSGLTDGTPFSVTVLKLENNSQANQWKLLSFGKDANHPKQTTIMDDTGAQYITINVKSIKPFLERLKKHNIKILSDDGLKVGNGNLFVLIQDPDGTFIELMGPE